MKCLICNKEMEEKELTQGYKVRPSVAKLIKSEHNEWNDDSYICKNDLNDYRARHLMQLLKNTGKHIQATEKKVIDSITNNEFITTETNSIDVDSLSIGEKVADMVAKFGGSWKFIIIFMSVLFGWVFINVLAILDNPFDPYPFILLNLILSCIAAIQAPIIMMSQNRQEKKDRQRAEDDYKVNLKAELEIKVLIEKIDHLMEDQKEMRESIKYLHENAMNGEDMKVLHKV